jgi:ectoine hydroxylase-related dioxygenase (phytanoyl-CoA dioxygenase family)
MMRTGSGSGVLHGGSIPFFHDCYYRVVENRIYNGLFAVAFSLSDQPAGAGGFVCLPGSHKSEFRVPQRFQNIDEATPYLEHIPFNAGSALLFTEALAHGTLRWTGEHERRIIFVKYSPGNASWVSDYTSADYVPDAEWTAVERLLLEPPYQSRGREFRPQVVPDDR